ncbi:glutamate-rich protein 4 [Sorex araneus]|uniref:glutamate-rich protein 4 n=1 Tax=Sorex araneus TaxID=42254 RepID=UPI002433A9BD|nr:glutamate-rich protein 4 [Sorex araneus]
MELWQQLQQAEMVPPELGPPPRALLGVPPAETAGSTLSSSRAESWGASASKSLRWIWEELGNLRRVDVQLLGQLCSLGLELKALREELAFLEEEEEEEPLEEEVDEEDEEPENREKGPLGVSCSVPGYRLPDFEMTI